MVVFWPRSEPSSVLQVFSTVTLTANLTSLFRYDFNAGSFAQFGDPDTVARIDHRSERTDLHNISHLAIRQLLDAVNFKDEFILIDEHTAQNHAIWWVTSSQNSQFVTEAFVDIFHNPPVSYPGEAFVLWQSHIMIQDLAYDYDSAAAGETTVDDLITGDRIHPYDPHDPQEPPLNEGRDYTIEDRAGCPPFHQITASFSEIMYTTDPKITQYKGTRGCVALTPEAAKLSGMLSPEWLIGDAAINEWSPWGVQHVRDPPYVRPPRPGDVINLQAIGYDWHSPRWPPPGVAAPFPGPTGNLSLASRIVRHPSHPIVGSLQQCVRRKPRRPTSPLVAVSR